MKPRIVCFDLGGVVVRICRSFGEACERAGLPVRDPKWLDSDPVIEARRGWIRAYQAGQVSTRHYVRELARSTEGRYSEQEILQVHDAWLCEEYPGVLTLVESLNASNEVVTACLSNTNERHWSALAERGASAFPSVLALEHRLASHLLGVSKPDRQIYEQAEHRLGARADEILFFDDLDANVDAARSAGWLAERVDPEGATAEQMEQHLARHGVVLEKS